MNFFFNKINKIIQINSFQSKLEILKFYYSYVKHGVFIIILFSLISGFLESLGLSILFPIIQNVMSQTNSFELPSIFNQLFVFFDLNSNLVNFLIFFFALFVFKSIIKFFTGYLKVYYSGKFLFDLRVNLINYLINYDFLKFTANDTGKISSTLTMEVEKLLSGFIYFCNYLVTLFTGISFLIVIFYLNYKFAVVILSFGALYYLLFVKTNLKIKNLSKEITLNNSNFNSLLIQFIQSFKYLKSTNNFLFIKKLLNSTVVLIRKQHLQKDIRSNVVASIQEPAIVLMLILIILFSIKIIKVHPKTSILIILLFYRSTSYFINSQSIWNSFLSQIGGTKSVIDFEKTLIINKEIHNGRKEVFFKDKIIFKDVTFKYSSDLKKNILNNVHIEFACNKTTAIIGKSGSGKSTLINLLSGLLVPTSGEIIIDGVSIEEIDINKWRTKIGYITQDSVIFNDTILNNITLWNYDSKKDKVRLFEIIRMVHLDDLIVSELVLNRFVGDRGIGLSGGQKQRIAIARELYKNPQILILDEATSALDSETENFINKSLEELNGKVTIVVIAHRLSTIKKANNIYIIEDGKTIENGSYKNLLSNKDSKFNSYIQFQTL